MKIAVLLCITFVFVMLVPADSIHSSSAPPFDVQCKELNDINCYSGKNEGNFCNRKDQTKTEIRWYYDKGVCKKFTYNGCNGNRNRFCTQNSCERRCSRNY